MPTESKFELRYHPTFCVIGNKQVQAIAARQSDGSWRIVNCLDKDEACFDLECAFSSDNGNWPFQAQPGKPSDVI